MKKIEKHFARIGARVDVRPAGASLDVENDRFQVGADMRVVHVQPAIRHLLLMRGRISKFLCGHDERHWFVAAIPENARGVRDVATAMEALKPQVVRDIQEVRRVKPKLRQRRRNDVFIRQGEWFFVPAPEMNVPAWLALRNEPLSRGAGSKPHVVEFCYRTGGETVYVNRVDPHVFTEAEYRELILQDPFYKTLSWDVRVRDPEVYAKGRVRHPDHKTLHLDSWHRVLMNTENQAEAMAHVAFID